MGNSTFNATEPSGFQHYALASTDGLLGTRIIVSMYIRRYVVSHGQAEGTRHRPASPKEYAHTAPSRS